jgi:hypothetical protein
MARTEAMKQAQRIYRLKIQEGEQYKINEAKHDNEKTKNNSNDKNNTFKK